MSLDKRFKNNLDYIISKLQEATKENSKSKKLKLAIAVSGGGDSVALLHLAHKYQKQNPESIDIFCYSVDHRLRPESKEEVLHVKNLCKDLNIKHISMEWHWEDDGFEDKTKITQEHARNARYKLLTNQCDRDGVNYILLAHHLDDQAETVLMRKNNQSTWFGLSGISAASRMDRDKYLIRPLLNIRKQELINYLKEHNIKWFEDPSNQNPKYKRSIIRKELQENKKLFDETVELQKNSAKKRIAIEEKSSNWFMNEKNIMIHPEFGFIWMDSKRLLSQEQDIDLISFILMRAIKSYTKKEKRDSNLRPIPFNKFISITERLKNNDNIKLNALGCVIQKNKNFILIYKGKEITNKENYDNSLKGFSKKQTLIREDGSWFFVNINSHIIAQMPDGKIDQQAFVNECISSDQFILLT